jgi:preprotein translocase subunit SecB
MAKKPKDKTENAADEADVAPPSPAAGADAAGNGTDQAKPPSMRIVAQYLKDLSFENPNAPSSLKAGMPSPKVDIAVNVNAKTLGPTDYEIELHLEAKAQGEDGVAFAAELVYAGMFHIENVPPEALHQVVLIECPRVLFPFARQIMAHATQQGGFPPLMLDPIDFAGMYRQRMAQQAAGGSERASRRGLSDHKCPITRGVQRRRRTDLAPSNDSA